jgi:dihydrodipicolinate synthase/N-acetylneuraminate lyase
MSVGAHGTVGGVLTYSARKIVNQVRYQRAQKDYVSEARRIQRDIFRLANDMWNHLPQNEKDLWKEIAENGSVNI